ncbi:MAG: hypothetical protein KJ062_13120 [Thermoanaerobaculia bacterium]|nr:hypothetical protein [Thermoanaerobaculia bacterium]
MPREIEIFREEIPPMALQSIARAVIKGCKRACRFAKATSSGLYRDAVWATRRIYVERELRSLALGPGIEVSEFETPSTSYTLIETARLRMTAATRTHHVDWVEPYPYRETLARSMNRDLFRDEAEQADQKLYALLIYGGRRESPEPTQLRIVFPLPSGYFFESEIDLLAEFPALVGRSLVPTVEVPVPEVRLRPTGEETEKKSG